MSSGLTIALMIIAILCFLASLAGGIVCIVRYVRTRKVAMLILGLVLTLVVPGICLCIALAVAIPGTLMAYGPPPEYLP
jgi:hypothetical protein